MTRLDPEYLAYRRKYPQNGAQVQDMSLGEIQKQRQGDDDPPGRDSPPIEVGCVTHATEGVFNLELLFPTGENAQGGWPFLIYFHGGGFVFGSKDSEKHLRRAICMQAGCVVISVDYRLAPENKFPAAVEDCLAVVKLVYDIGGKKWRLNLAKGGIGGMSAGGSLATVVAHEKTSQAFLFQLLIVPVTDITIDAEKSESWTEDADKDGFTAKKMKGYIEHYVQSEGDRSNQRASPTLYGKENFGKLPLMIIVLADKDILYDQGSAYADKAESAGVQVIRHVGEGMPHSFMTLDHVLKCSRGILDKICEDLKKVFGVEEEKLVLAA